MNVSTFKSPAAWIPIGMSLAALAMVFIHIAMFGTAPQPDEGATARIWQLLMMGQAPVLIFYAVKWLPRNPKEALAVLGIQIVAALAAFAPVYLLGW